MIAAIYARKSTEQAVADDQKSVARQVTHAGEYAVRKGWSVEDALVFVDDGISGAEFAARPGYQRLMASLKPRPPFDVLVMSESSRLGREAWETGYALKQLLVAGVRVFFYLEDRECTFEHPLDKLQFSIVQAFDEMERARASQRSTDKAISQARAGHVTGGRLFGYDNVEIPGPAGTRSHVERRINEPEAAVVRRIFELAASGVGQRRIACQLNAEGTLAPRSQQSRPRSWATSSVHEVLFRPVYRGELVWNRTRKRNHWGEKRVTDRPEEQWLRRPVPELRIVPEELWQAAHARIEQARAQYRDATKGLRGGRPRIDSKYLLPGLARCGCCGGGLCVRTASSGSGDRRRRAFSYACTSHLNRGHGVCGNGLRVSMPTVDHEVLKSVRDILTPDLFGEVLEEMRALLEGGGDARELERERLSREIATTEVQVERYADAIAAAGSVPAVVARLKAAEGRRQALAARLASLGEASAKVRHDWRAIERQARERLQQWRAVLTRQPGEARVVLRELLEGRKITFTPLVDRRGFAFEGDAGAGGLVTGEVLAGHGNWRPHRDSNPNAVLEKLRFEIDGEVRRHAA